MITLDHVYYVIGVLLLAFTGLTLLDKQHQAKRSMAAFWGLYGIVFLFGKVLPPAVIGGVVVLLAIIAAAKWMGTGSYDGASLEFRRQMSERFKLWLFAPALVVPITAFLIAFLLPKWGLLVGLGIGSVIGFLFAWMLTRASLVHGLNEGRRLIDAIGWAVILPQFLAALGFLFDKAGVGKVIAKIVTGVVPTDSRLAVVVAYCVGMALFTMIMGNAFAAFAVMTTGIGIPLVIEMHGANAAIASVIAMVSGYCGTLMTPMAANFNIVPAALLEMKDQNGVIKAQVLTALPVLAINIVLMFLLAFPSSSSP